MTQDIDTYCTDIVKKHSKKQNRFVKEFMGVNPDSVEFDFKLKGQSENATAHAILEVEGIIEALEYILKYSPLMQLVIEGRIAFYKAALNKLKT